MVSEKTLKYRSTRPSIATRRHLVFGYLDEPEDKRLDLKKFLKSHRIQKRTFYLLEGEYRAKEKALTKRDRDDHKQELKATVMDAWDVVEGREPPKRTAKGYKIEEITDDERLALARKVYTDAMGKGASKGEKELAVRMLGMLVERQEIKVGLTADEIARRNTEAEKQLRDGGF